MHSSYTRRKIKALSERGKRMAAARWKLDRERRETEMPERIRELAEIEVENLPRCEGDVIGCLQWHDFASGKITRWAVEIGNRRDRRVFRSPDGSRAKSLGWTWLLTALRKKISNHQT